MLMIKVSDHSIKLNEYPFPPSTNRLTVNRKKSFAGRRGRAKSDAYTIFSGHCERYNLINCRIIDDCHDVLKEWLNQGYLIEVKLLFYFRKKRIYDKKGLIKSIDTPNFMKGLLDELAKTTLVDDRYFKSGSWKTGLVDDDETEFVDIELVPCRIEP